MVAPFTISCCSIAFRDRPLHEALAEIARAGFAGVEIWHPHVAQMSGQELQDVAGAGARLGLKMTVLAPYFSFTRGQERRRESLRHAVEVLGTARTLGIGKIRTFVDCGDDGLSSREATAADWKDACDGLKELCALDPDIEFVVETHEATLADSLPSVRRLFHEVGAPNLRLNYQANSDFLERGFLACLQALFPFVSHMHWEQIKSGGGSTYLEESGLIDFAALISLLIERRYQGTASVEYCWSPV
jgi:sugar phosphate isomerase/epimerase